MTDAKAKKPEVKTPNPKVEKTAEVKPADTEEPKKNRNLLILGLASVGIAIATTSVSLFLYHSSGNIYLDRSRPGFLPDDEEVEQQQGQKKDFTFNSNGNLTPEILQEYLQNYREQLDALDKLEKPFSSTPLSDESLGIPKE